MFWPDVIALKEFYATHLGQVTRSSISRHIGNLWPDVSKDTILGMGFAAPYLNGFKDHAQCVLACMPAMQGVIHWPADARNLSLLADEGELPFPDNSIQKILVIHALENSEQARQMLAEIWRVLAPAGRVLAIVPNRRGIWARLPQSPFAYGQPFTLWQLRQLLSDHSFTPLQSKAALFFAPANRRSFRSTRLWETLGCRFFPVFGGVLLLEAEKRLYAPLTQKVRRPRSFGYDVSAQPAA